MCTSTVIVNAQDEVERAESAGAAPCSTPALEADGQGPDREVKRLAIDETLRGQ
jgi:hypothetical protein